MLQTELRTQPSPAKAMLWRPTDDVLVPLPGRSVPVHLRTFARRPGERAVVIGEFTDQEADLLEILPWAWRRIARDLDPDRLQVFTFAPTAAEPFRRHESGRHIGGERVPVQRMLSRTPSEGRSSGRWKLGDGPTVHAWHARDYLHAHWKKLIHRSSEIRWDERHAERVLVPKKNPGSAV